MTKSEYDARYRRPIAGFGHLAIARDKKTFLFSGETWLTIALGVGVIFVFVLFFSLPGMSAAWGAFGLVVRIICGLALAAGFLLMGMYDEYRYKKRWTRVLSMVLCAAFAVAIFLFCSLPAIRDVGAKPVTGTFRVTEFVPRRRSLSDDMVAVEVNTGQRVEFLVFDFSRESKALHEKLKTSQPIVAIKYYPHSKVRIRMEY